MYIFKLYMLAYRAKGDLKKIMIAKMQKLRS